MFMTHAVDLDRTASDECACNASTLGANQNVQWSFWRLFSFTRRRPACCWVRPETWSKRSDRFFVSYRLWVHV